MIFLWILLANVFCSTFSQNVKAILFDPQQSSSFRGYQNESFQLAFLDGSMLGGYVAEDFVQLASFYARVKFGCIERSEGSWQLAGILGLGFPSDRVTVLSTPLFYSLAGLTDPLTPQTEHSDLPPVDNNASNIEEERLLSTRVFSLLLGDRHGELQLGGYDPDSIDPEHPDVVFTPVLPECDRIGRCSFVSYQIQVESIRLGDSQLYDIASDGFPLHALLDSGTTCLVLPTKSGDQAPYLNIYEHFSAGLDGYKDVRAAQPSIFIKINGHEFGINFDDYVLDSGDSSSPRVCVITLKRFPNLFLLGDVFLKGLLAIHNLTDLNQPSIGFAKRNIQYEPITAGSESNRRLAVDSAVSRLPLQQSVQPPAVHSFGRRLSSMTSDHDRIDSKFSVFEFEEYDATGWPIKHDRRLDANTTNENISKAPVSLLAEIQYSTVVSIGFPRQRDLLVILDTGSSTLAVFSASNGSPDIFLRTVYVLIGCTLLISVFGLFTKPDLIWRWIRKQKHTTPLFEIDTNPDMTVV